MTREIFLNNSRTVLAADVQTGDTSIQVVGGVWPTAGQFTILVDNEYMLVTAVNSLTFTVVRAQEGSAATVHPKGDSVRAVVTVGSLGRLARQSVNGVNMAARREINFIPSGCTISIADNPNTDSADVTITASGGGGGSGYTAPPSDGWTLYQGSGNSGTFTTDAAGVNILEAGANSGGSENVKFLYRSLPATPFKITGVVLSTPPAGNQNANYGLMFGESSTGRVQALGYYFNGNSPAGLQLNAWCWNGPNSYNTNPKTVNLSVPTMTYVQLGYDGTNMSWAYSNDNVNFVTFFASSKNAFFSNGPDQIGFYMNAQNGTGAGAARLVHWKQS